MTVLLAILIAVSLIAWMFFRSKSPGGDQVGAAERQRKLDVSKSKRAAAKSPAQKVSEQSLDAEIIADVTAPQQAEVASLQPDQVVEAIKSTGQDVAQSAIVLIDEQPATTHDVEGLRKGLERSRRAEGFFGRLASILLGRKELSPEIASEIEEVLLTSDVGVQTTQVITDRIRESLSKRDLNDPNVIWEAVREEARKILRGASADATLRLRNKPAVILLVGVNGAGKTTTIGKLATRFKSQGRSVLLAAGDTFRAAAVQQLCVWGDRIGVEVVRGKDGADPGSVVFDAVRKAQETGIDVVLADTAGRLHTKANLMAELKKVIKTTSRALDGTPFEVLLVVDATNGQNAVAQAKEFCAELPLTGMVLTKLDGTAKGGFVVGIAAALQLPVKLIGLGEKATDLHDFDPDDFVEALLGQVREGASA